MKHQLKLGKSAGDLINAFMGGDAYERKGYEEQSGKLASAERNRQAARKTGLEADVLERAAGIDLSDIMQAFGAETEELVPAYSEETFSPYRPEYQQEQEVLRGVTKDINLANLMAGKSSTINQLIEAFSGARKRGDIDAIRRGQFDPGMTGKGYAATEGKPLYKQGTSGILDIFTGGVEPTEYSRRTQGVKPTALMQNVPAISKYMGISEKEAATLLTQGKQENPTQFYKKIVAGLIRGTHIDDVDDVKIAEISAKIMSMVYGDTWQNPNVPAGGGGKVIRTYSADGTYQ